MMLTLTHVGRIKGRIASSPARGWPGAAGGSCRCCGAAAAAAAAVVAGSRLRLTRVVQGGRAERTG
jgi:hypothetical protein